MANMSRALALRALADEIETKLSTHRDPVHRPDVLQQIADACSQLARLDPKASVLAERMVTLAAAYYGEDASSRRLGGTDLNYIEMHGRLLGAIRARANAYLAVARF